MISFPASLWIIITIISLLMFSHLHGKPRPPYNFWNCLIGILIETVILYWGGFFTIHV